MLLCHCGLSRGGGRGYGCAGKADACRHRAGVCALVCMRGCVLYICNTYIIHIIHMYIIQLTSSRSLSLSLSVSVSVSLSRSLARLLSLSLSHSLFLSCSLSLSRARSLSSTCARQTRVRTLTRRWQQPRATSSPAASMKRDATPRRRCSSLSLKRALIEPQYSLNRA